MGRMREMERFFIVGEEEGEREEEREGDSPAGAGCQRQQRRWQRRRRTALFCLRPPRILYLVDEVEERRVRVCYAAVGLDRLGHGGQHKEGEVASVVMEGQIGAIEANNGVQQALKEGIEGGHELPGDGVRSAIEAAGGLRADVV
jgi:hypothetical protein